MSPAKPKETILASVCDAAIIRNESGNMEYRIGDKPATRDELLAYTQVQAAAATTGAMAALQASADLLPTIMAHTFAPKPDAALDDEAH